MHNPEAHELINSCHRLSGRIDDLNNEIEDAEEELEAEKKKLRKVLDETGEPQLIIEGYGLNYRITPWGQSLVRIDLAD
ncbi:MAG: hypothetical protein IM597_18735 [Pseudanabaena sp. M176S2SP2A07QC]|nr:hypothetical protein [Pseudanabaena sp. M176S2SP2A07QC]